MSETRTINAVGWECPKPIIATKQMLDTMCEGTVLTIVDNQIALDNLMDFAKSVGYQCEHEEKDGIFYVKTTKDESCEATMAELTGRNDNLVIAVTSDCFGVGNDDLGATLMKSYLFALTEADKLPQTLIFVNKGVTLACEGSACLDAIQALADAGVEIMACGACLNFYGLTEALAIGTISNMYMIVNKMNNATNTIKI
ncbi:MAG: sulfurtransferase-like selenium metabolism protein YedF [Bacillota bacterium]